MPVERCKTCAREARLMTGYCCEACESGKPVHTPGCNEATWPEWRGAKYLDDPDAAQNIVESIQQTLSLCHVVQQNLRTIASAGNQFLPNYSLGIDMMLDHLSIDIRYCEAEARKLLGG